MTANYRRTGAGAEYIVLGGSKPFMFVDQGEGTGVIPVSGSQLRGRDPSAAQQHEQLELLALIRQQAEREQKEKMCGKCCQWKNRVAFSPDKRNADGLHSYCKHCRNKDARVNYKKTNAA